MSTNEKPDAEGNDDAARKMAAEVAARAMAQSEGSTAVGRIKPKKVPAEQAKKAPVPVLKDEPPDLKLAPSARMPMVLGGIALLVLVGGFGGWAALTNIAGAIIATGQIEVERNRQVVQHLDGGVVDKVLVREGDVVKAGDVLIQLDADQLASDLALVEGQLFEYMARIGRMTAERDDADEISFMPLLVQNSGRPEVAELMQGQENLFRARLETVERETEQLAKRRDQIGSQVEGIDAQSKALATQLGLIEKELADQQSLLDRGLTQQGRVLSLQREQARLAGVLGELTANRAQAEGRMTEIDIELIKLKASRREESITRLRDMQTNQLQLLEQRHSILQRMERLDIRAPVSGIVYGLTVTTPRAVIRPAEPVLYLVPQDRPLVIMAQVEPIHIDQVHVGQEVRVRFSALDARTTPELVAHVVQISADAFTDERTQHSYYRAEVELDDGELEKLNGQPILPGMPVETYLRTADRTPIAYLVKPFTDYFNKAFRET